MKAGGQGIIPGMIYLDETFTWDTMREGPRRRSFPLVHIASRFRFSPGNDTMSFLLPGDGTTLTLSDVKLQTNLFGGVDLLTLSACRTAMGNAGKREGKEVEGFAVLARRQGAKAVLATLWPVADKSTALFMQTLYGIKETERLSKAEALRRTQEMFIRGKMEGGASEKRENAPYAYPYFWAPFVLIGSWK